MYYRMAFGGNCGAQLAEDAKFCISRGNAVNASSNTQAEQQYQQQQQQYARPQYQEPVQSDEADISENKAMGILAYISWLVLVPLFAAKESKFARFHTNQGLVLAISESAYAVTALIVGKLFSLIAWWLGMVMTVLFWLAAPLFVVFTVLGIVNAAHGRCKELPIIGKFRIIK